MEVTANPIRDQKISIKANGIQWEQMEYNRFAIVPMVLTVIAIFGAITAATVLHSTFHLGFLLVASLVTVFPVVNILSVSSMKSIIRSSIISVVFDVLLIAIVLSVSA